ncbi:unnamed protein product, partial [Rotaria magnacalcarata]
MPSFPQHRNQISSSSNQPRPALSARLSSSSNEPTSAVNDSRKRQNLPPLRVGCTNMASQGQAAQVGKLFRAIACS